MKGQRIKDVHAIKNLCDDINTRRECILSSLVIYLSEVLTPFFKAYLASSTKDVERDISSTGMGIYMVRSYDNGEPEDVGIVIEGINVLNNVGSVIMGFILLFGLIYALDLRFPENLKYTFEFFQKIIMNLDGHKLNTKIQKLKFKFASEVNTR